MKTLISLGLIAFIAMIISFAVPTKSSYAGPCVRILDTSVWECYGSGGNCCDDVVVYG